MILLCIDIFCLYCNESVSVKVDKFTLFFGLMILHGLLVVILCYSVYRLNNNIVSVVNTIIVAYCLRNRFAIDTIKWNVLLMFLSIS